MGVVAWMLNRENRLSVRVQRNLDQTRAITWYSRRREALPAGLQ